MIFTQYTGLVKIFLRTQSKTTYRVKRASVNAASLKIHCMQLKCQDGSVHLVKLSQNINFRKKQL